MMFIYITVTIFNIIFYYNLFARYEHGTLMIIERIFCCLENLCKKMVKLTRKEVLLTNVVRVSKATPWHTFSRSKRVVTDPKDRLDVRYYRLQGMGSPF